MLLEPHEELALCKYYEKRLLDFCAAFKPLMPRSVVVSETRTEPQSRPPLFLRLLPAWLVLEGTAILKAFFFSSSAVCGRFLSFLFRFLAHAAISKPDVFQPDLLLVVSFAG